MDEGATAESASLLLEGARNREPWAVELLLQHLIPLTPEMTATSGNNGPTIGPVPLRDATVEQKLSLTAGATTTPQSDSQTLKQPTVASPQTAAESNRRAVSTFAAEEQPSPKTSTRTTPIPNTPSVEERSPALIGRAKTALDAAAFGLAARASDGSWMPQWRDYNITRSPMRPGELASTVKAEPVPSPPRPGRAVAPPTPPAAPPPTLPPLLDPNERTKGSALYRLNNPRDRRTNTQESGRYIVVEKDKRVSLAHWGNNRLRRK